MNYLTAGGGKLKGIPNTAKVRLSAALTLGLFILSGCSQDSIQSQTSKPKTRRSAHLVETLIAAKAPVETVHTRTGSLRARRLVRIHSQEEGRITDLPWFEGDRVESGATLVRLEDALLKAQLAKATATTRQARQDLKRIVQLVKKRAASDDALARARTELDVALAEERLLQTRLTYTRISAPFGGTISQRMVEPGDVVAKHSHLLTLIDPQSLITELRVSELLLPHLSAGDSVKVRIDALGDQTFPGRILRIHPELDRITRQGIVEVILDPVPEGARAGQFARITLKTVAISRMLIPFNALRHDRVGEFVFLVDSNNQARRTPVRSGIHVADEIEILQGLEAGQAVVSKGFLGLVDGKTVKPIAPPDQSLPHG